MRGDFSRWTFDQKKHYSRVLMQQGRVQVDADWNEQQAITAHRNRIEARDLIGGCGVPKHGGGFQIKPATGGDFIIGAGRMYVDGILCENDADVHYIGQSDLPATKALSKPGRYIVYLDVWERHVTALDDPRIREVALGGPDTATRVKTVCQVKTLAVGASDTCATQPQAWSDLIAPSTGTLNARTQPNPQSNSPCTLPPTAGYTRLENQLYRVEIHNASTSSASSFVWSRDNGTVVTSVTGISGQDISVHDIGPDDALGFANGQWIEISDDSLELNGLPGELIQIQNVDAATNTITLQSAPTLSFNANFHTKLRRWDGTGAITQNVWIPLEAGIEVQFSGGTYNAEDYWLIPARPATGEIEWPPFASPNTNPVAQPPRGIRHHFCRLAIIDVVGGGRKQVTINLIEDCRQPFPPLTEIEDCCGCCTKTVGQTDAADCRSIGEALALLPNEGGQICVLDGTYPESVQITGKQNITIIGCGERSILTAGLSETGTEIGPIMQIENSTNIRLESLFFQQALLSAVVVLNSSRVIVSNCEIEMTNPEGSEPAIFFQCTEGLIDHNFITGLARVLSRDEVAARAAGAPVHTVPPHAASGIQLAGGCRRVRVLENFIFSVRGQGVTLGNLEQAKPQAPVGLIIRGLLRNPGDPCEQCKGPTTRVFPPPTLETPPLRAPESLWDIIIEKNRILSAGLDGIGVIGFFDLSSIDEFVSVRGLRILGNEITDCLQSVVDPIDPALVDSMGYGGIALADVSELVIYDNVIARNGSRHTQPVCGVFVLHGGGIDIQRNRIAGNGLKAAGPLFQSGGVIASATNFETSVASAAAKIAPGPFATPTSGPTPTPSILSGRQGGIQIVYAVAPTSAASASAPTATEMIGVTGRANQPTGFPALKVHDNIVSAQVGPALAATVLGPVSVVANQFTSYHFSQSQQSFPVPPATVGLLDLGVSRQWYFQQPSFASVAAPQTSRVFGYADFLTSDRLAGSKILFTDNQCLLNSFELPSNALSVSVLLMSLDDVAFENNQCEWDLVGREPRIVTHALLFAFSLRATGNCFKEGLFSVRYSAITAGQLNLTAHNQSTNCLLIIPAPHPPPSPQDQPNTMVVELNHPGYCNEPFRLFQTPMG